ncbi:unnamed protein product, partial [Staurois parvus]
MSAQSCDQLCPITANPVPPVSVHQCQLSVLIHATCQCHINATYQCLPVHINAHLSCLSVSPISASQCHLSMPVSATYQCCQSVPPVSAAYTASPCHLTVPVSAAYQCHLSVPYMSAAFQCPSVMPVNAHQCHLPVPPHQCHLS